MKLYRFSLSPGQDLKLELEYLVQENNIRAGFVLTCVGGLSQATLRMAGATPQRQDVRVYLGEHKITSLVGTVGDAGMHLNMSISDNRGQVMGGQLKDGTIVNPSVEIVIGEEDSTGYERAQPAEADNYSDLGVQDDFPDEFDDAY